MTAALRLFLIVVYALCRGTLRPRGRPTLALGAIKAVERMVGGDVESNGIFDPFGFSSDEPSLFRRRAVELKHGRVCMLATLGVLVQSVWRPFSEPYLQNPRPLGALRDCWEAKSAYVCLAVLAVGLLDCTLGKQDYDSRAPGDLGLFADWAKPDTQEAWENTQLSELKHGRLAMVAIVAMLLQEPLLGDGPIQIAYDVTTPVRDIVLDATRTVIRSL